MDDRKYYCQNGEERSLYYMVRHEPDWAANRIREGEKAIFKLARAMKVAEAAIHIHHFGSTNNPEEVAKFVKTVDTYRKEVEG